MDFNGEGKEYRRYFSEGKAYALLKKLRKATRDKIIIGDAVGIIVEALGHLLSAFNNPLKPPSKKLEVAAAIGYIVLPADLIPDTLPVAGYTDDIAATVFIVSQIKIYSTFDIIELDNEIDRER